MIEAETVHGGLVGRMIRGRRVILEGSIIYEKGAMA
jgi:hypothetical protein